MYRYTVMFLSTAIAYVVVFLLLDLVFGKPFAWAEYLFGGVVFGAIMTGIQIYKERNKQ